MDRLTTGQTKIFRTQLAQTFNAEFERPFFFLDCLTAVCMAEGKKQPLDSAFLERQRTALRAFDNKTYKGRSTKSAPGAKPVPSGTQQPPVASGSHVASTQLAGPVPKTTQRLVPTKMQVAVPKVMERAVPKVMEPAVPKAIRPAV